MTALSRLLSGAVRLYQGHAPRRVRGACRFEPSCSDYALLALDKHGAFRGTGMALSRLARCRSPNGGIDHP